MATVASALPEIEYPSSDGEPMAETPIHRNVIYDAIAMLGGFFAEGLRLLPRAAARTKGPGRTSRECPVLEEQDRTD
jgi:hypothetical protein